MLEPVLELLDWHGLSRGPVRARRIGEGISNVTFLLERDDRRMALRRPPRPPYHQRAHDVLREARLLTALRAVPWPPRVLATCEDPGPIGAPFYVMEHVEGEVLTDTLPAFWQSTQAATALADELVDTLVALHELPWLDTDLADFGRPDTMRQRRVDSFGRIWDSSPHRDIPRPMPRRPGYAPTSRTSGPSPSRTATTGSAT
ncbi:hypothetical protein GCM10017577_10060 [Pseudonocardia halophobica]|uniref:Aminoglycoside phosphotransferase domain-containing protein n=1 Tax=Pseudonocardia halophobica TaxID=29401 RepID=A0A9W6NUV8_9PSEU|nr:phosphotransferase family protein [Pseudonocardia halophobica]GLL09866.1 hypothetical protein GCM10017577_10060 [Pseudonocardia halophobica]